jgi:hypothetical protein
MARSNNRKRVGRGRRSAQMSIAKNAGRSELARERALRALAAIRRGATLSLAARENGVTPRTIKRYVGTALVQSRRGGRIRALKSDRLVRYLVTPGPHGPMQITVRGSRTASEFAKYKAAVNRFLRGDRDAMAPWHGKKIAGIELITAGGTLKSIADKGLLPYSLYRSFSGGGR